MGERIELIFDDTPSTVQVRMCKQRPDGPAVYLRFEAKIAWGPKESADYFEVAHSFTRPFALLLRIYNAARHIIEPDVIRDHELSKRVLRQEKP